MFVGITNWHVSNTDMIDSAMLRPGRLDKLLYVPLPSPEERIDILKTCLRHTPVDSSVNIVQLAMSDKCNGFRYVATNFLIRKHGASSSDCRVALIL